MDQPSGILCVPVSKLALGSMLVVCAKAGSEKMTQNNPTKGDSFAELKNRCMRI
jgi:hypothetical protein